MKHLLLVSVLGSAALGCGDNSKQCGPGTIEMNGVCTPDGTQPPTCTDGTILDVEMNTCVIDPDACQDGTVLVGTECKDPGHLTVDVEEAAEPNGLTFFGEDSADGAGIVTIKAVGETAVIHGKIIPFQDADGDGQLDPDVDTYLITVAAPTLVEVSADGLHGMVGGFASIAAAGASNPLADWTRIGVSVVSDTARRQMFLPAAGIYAIVIADSRSLITGAAAGKDTANANALDFEYYISITQQTATATALTPTAGVATTSGTLNPGEVKLFTVPMGLGVNTAIFSVAEEDFSESLVVTNTRGGATLAKRVADQDDDLGFAFTTQLIGFVAGDTTTIVADHVVSFTNAPTEFDLAVLVGDAGALSRVGGSVAQPKIAGAGGDVGDLTTQDTQSMTVFFYDVTAANEIDGMNLVFDTAVTGVLVDENFTILANFTFDPTVDVGNCGGVCGFAFEDTFTSYVGHLRHPAAGRYYFLVFDAGGTGNLTATSTITAVTPGAVVKDTTTATQTVSAVFQSNAFTYAAGTTVAWQQFNGDGTGTGNLTISYFDAGTTFGRLDPITTTCGAFCEDRVPVFTTTHAANGSQPRGRILLDDIAAMGGSDYLLTVKTANSAGTFDLTFDTRPHTDLGTKNAGDVDNQNDPIDNSVNGAVRIQRYLVRTARDNEVSLLVNPSALLNATIAIVNNDEGPRTTVNAAGLNGNETAVTYQRGDGWTAWTVTGAAVQPTDGTFDLTTTILAAEYALANTATAFSDVCPGNTTIAFANSDNAMSATITGPANFSFFGAAASNFRVSTNGFLTFNTALTASFPANVDMPTAAQPNLVIAPYWDDLALVEACTGVVAGRTVIQWTGFVVATGDSVEFQAILDPSDDTIEFVWGPNHTALGEGATIGVENAAGDKSKVIGFDQANAITSSSSKKLTPQ